MEKTDERRNYPAKMGLSNETQRQRNKTFKLNTTLRDNLDFIKNRLSRLSQAVDYGGGVYSGRLSVPQNGNAIWKSKGLTIAALSR